MFVRSIERAHPFSLASLLQFLFDLILIRARSRVIDQKTEEEEEEASEQSRAFTENSTWTP